MSISKLAEIYEAEQARLGSVHAARARRDAAQEAYEKARRTLAQLEGRSPGGKTKDKSEPAMQAARSAVYEARLALQKAQRELLKAT